MLLMLTQPSGEPAQCLGSSVNHNTLSMSVACACVCCLVTALPHLHLDQSLWLQAHHGWQDLLLMLIATVTNLWFLC